MDKNTVFRCRFCHKACNGRADLEEHVRTHQGETGVTCRGCGEDCESKDFFARHSCTASDKGNRFNCDLCENVYVTDAELQQHVHEHYDEVEKFQCKLCNSSFCGRYDLQRHLEVHHSTRHHKYMCPICVKRFESKLSLECHLQEHEKGVVGTHDTLGMIPSDGVGVAALSSVSETFFCNVCGQTFDQEGHLRQHLDGHFQRKSYECDICNSRFVGPFFLKHHMQVHSGARPYLCSQCGTGYRQKDLLMKHFVIHGVPKMDNRIEQLQEASSREEVKHTVMSASHAGNDTNALIEKKVDQKLDNDEVDFIDMLRSCDSEENESVFGEAQAGRDDFTKISNLTEEMLSHIVSQDEPLQTKQLEENSVPMLGGGDQFILPLNQRTLQGCTTGTVHRENRKIFPCDLCNKVFKIKSHCQRHRRIHTGEMPYECRVCKRKFKWRSSLVTHSCLKSQEYKQENNSTTSDISVVDSGKRPTELQQRHSSRCVPEANGIVDVSSNVNNGFLCILCGKNFATEILLQSHISVHDGLQPDTATSETHMECQNDRLDPLQRREVVTRTIPAEHILSLLPLTDAGTDKLSCTSNEIIHQKQFQGSRKQPRLSNPRRKTSVTSYSNKMKEKKRKLFVCEICNKVSLSQNHYLRHKRLHTGEKPFECDRCNRKFMWKSSLDSHRNSHEKRDLHTTNTEVKEEKDSNEAFICLQCGKSFASEPELRNHVPIHESAKCFTGSAPKTDTGESQISHRAKDVIQQRKGHRSKHQKCHPEKPKGSTSEAAALSEQDRKKFVCEYCSKVFNNPSRYQRHLPFHTGEMPFQCNLCSKKYKWRSSLDSHKKSHDKKKEGFFSFNSVPLNASAQSDVLLQEKSDGFLEEDERSVGDKMFTCVVCEMDFATAMELQSHKSVHEDKKTDTDMAQLSARVNDAQQKYLEKSKKRKKPHTERTDDSVLLKDAVHEQNSKNFVCEVCSKVFHVKNHYNRHKRLHTEEMPYHCDQCDRVFKWRSSFDSHKKSHFHNKKKGPAVSSESSDYVSLIANELTQEHSETIPESMEEEESARITMKPFVCPQCGKDYESGLQLQIHMFIHGDEDYLQTHAGVHKDGTDPVESDGAVLHMTQHSIAKNPPLHGQYHGTGSSEKGKSGRTTSETASRHGKRKKKFTCEVCGKAFISQNHYRRHMPVHTGEMPFECDRCNRKFKWRSSLDSHKRSHDKKDAHITEVEYVSFIDSDEDL